MTSGALSFSGTQSTLLLTQLAPLETRGKEKKVKVEGTRFGDGRFFTRYGGKHASFGSRILHLMEGTNRCGSDLTLSFQNQEGCIKAKIR